MPRRSRVRIVVDTNVIVSGIIFPESNPGKVLTLAKDRCLALCSDQTAGELITVISRAKFDQWIALSDRVTAVERFLEMCGRIEHGNQLQVCRDDDDNRLLEVAVAGNAAYLITGDADLLALGAFEGTQIVGPREFCGQVDENAEA